MNLEVDVERLWLAQKTVRAELMAELGTAGGWVGNVSSSPVATAAAVSALVLSHRQGSVEALRAAAASDSQVIEQLVQGHLSELLLESMHWLARRQNADGGWGDCDGAASNVAATLLVQAAFRLTGVPAKYADLMMRADQFVAGHGGLVGLRGQPGRDRSYLAALLANCALADQIAWRQVPSLPFEWLCLPPRWQRDIGLPVARYAAPLVLAVGLAKFHHDPPRNPLKRLVRHAGRKKALVCLERLQASDDSFQASPLVTALVVVSLASIGHQGHTIVERGIEFLLSSVRTDSSWSVIANLATDNTSRAMESLTAQVITAGHVGGRSPGDDGIAWSETATLADVATVASPVGSVSVAMPRLGSEGIIDDVEMIRGSCVEWLLNAQHVSTTSDSDGLPGGWALADVPGGSTNTMSTAGALVALSRVWSGSEPVRRGPIERAVELGVDWLIQMQNAEGGWPTYHRNDDAHPLDASGIDPTSQAVRALGAWQRTWQLESRDGQPAARAARLAAMASAVSRGWAFLESQQRDDGRFVPLWFGNEHQANAENPVMGTALVLAACAELQRLEAPMAQRAAGWLVANQHANGGWGPPRAPVDYSPSERDRNSRSWRENESLAKFCSVEETSAAVTALLPMAHTAPALGRSVSRGLDWLINGVEHDRHRQPAIIGFYLPRLWYHERMNPLAWAAGALSRAVMETAPATQEAATSR